MIDFIQHHALELIKFLFECIVLIVILREVRELKRHHSALQAHEQQLAAVRPLVSNLYTGDDETMNLAVEFTRQAESIYALGTISSLAETERQVGETQLDYNNRIKAIDPRKREYVVATLARITDGCKYRRIMDLMPRSASRQDIFEVLANVQFFLHAYDTPGADNIDLEIYHNSEILRGRGDFHFRCSERQLVLRVGGHGNEYANSAIAITDTRVIHEFQRYFESLVASPVTRRLMYEDLTRLREMLLKEDVTAVRAILASEPDVSLRAATSSDSVKKRG